MPDGYIRVGNNDSKYYLKDGHLYRNESIDKNNLNMVDIHTLAKQAKEKDKNFNEEKFISDEEQNALGQVGLGLYKGEQQVKNDQLYKLKDIDNSGDISPQEAGKSFKYPEQVKLNDKAMIKIADENKNNPSKEMHMMLAEKKGEFTDKGIITKIEYHEQVPNKPDGYTLTLADGSQQELKLDGKMPEDFKNLLLAGVDINTSEALESKGKSVHPKISAIQGGVANTMSTNDPARYEEVKKPALIKYINSVAKSGGDITFDLLGGKIE